VKVDTIVNTLLRIGGIGIAVIGLLELCGVIELSLNTVHFYGIVLVILGCLILNTTRGRG